MQEFTQRRAAAPAGYRGCTCLFGFMESVDEGGQHMAASGVIVVAGSVEIGWHQADGIKAVLTAQGFRELDPGDFGDCIPLVSGFQSAR